MTTAQTLIDALEPLACANGLELVTVELVGSKKAPTIRIFLDAEGGISFDQIVGAHVWIDEYMEEHDPFPGAYTLEVSSPGIDRPLRTLEHFRRFVGEDVSMSYVKEGKVHKVTGRLDGVLDGDVVRVVTETGTVDIEFPDIRKAHVKGKIDWNGRKKEG